MSLKHSKDLCPLLGILMEHFNFLFVILQKKKKVLLGWGGGEVYQSIGFMLNPLENSCMLDISEYLLQKLLLLPFKQALFKVCNGLPVLSCQNFDVEQPDKTQHFRYLSAES